MALTSMHALLQNRDNAQVGPPPPPPPPDLVELSPSMQGVEQDRVGMASWACWQNAYDKQQMQYSNLLTVWAAAGSLSVMYLYNIYCELPFTSPVSVALLV